MTNYLITAVFLLGLALVATGAWILAPAAGLIVAGGELAIAAWLADTQSTRSVDD